MTGRSHLRQRVGNRTAIVAAGITGFIAGAGGLAAAQIGPDTTSSTGPDTVTVPEGSIHGTRDALEIGPVGASPTVDGGSTGAITEVTAATSTSASSTSNPASSTSVPASSTSNPASSTSNPASSTSNPTSSTSNPTSSTSNPTSSTSNPASSTSNPASNPGNTIAPLPGPFTETYVSAGGSITVTWSGSAFSLSAVSPAPGFEAEIEDQASDRIRVDFEGDHDARIEVRLNDGRVRVRID